MKGCVGDRIIGGEWRATRGFDDFFRRGQVDPYLWKRSPAKTGQAVPETSSP